MFKKYNFILGKSNTGKSKLLQNLTELFKDCIIFDFEANIIPFSSSKRVSYIPSKNISEVEKIIDESLEKIKEEIYIFLDGPDIFYVDKKSDLERIYKKYKNSKITFFTTLSTNSNFTSKEEDHYIYDSNKKFNLNDLECSTFITEKYNNTNKKFIYLEDYKIYDFLDLARNYKIEKILNEK
jgi:hypothetical protein